jgi:hypothetical protein
MARRAAAFSPRARDALRGPKAQRQAPDLTSPKDPKVRAAAKTRDAKAHRDDRDIKCGALPRLVSVAITPTSSPAEIVDACALEGSDLHVGKQLGCGEQGCAYRGKGRDGADSALVVKVTPLPSAPARRAWQAEVCLGREVANLAAPHAAPVAPRIYQSFECSGNGYIVMDTMDAVLSDAAFDGVPTRVKRAGGDPVDNLSHVPAALQTGLASVLARMIDGGFVHMDNHLGNLGLIRGTPVAFDFGFTQRRTFDDTAAGDACRLWALCFSLFQIVEHCAAGAHEGAVWAWASAILGAGLRGELGAGEWTWAGVGGALARGLVPAAALTPTQLGAALPAKTSVEDLRAWAAAPERASVRDQAQDLVVGSLCYGVLMQLKMAARYRHPGYEVVYAVRQGKFA